MHTQADFPSEWEQRLALAFYLSEYLEANVKPEDTAVTLLMDRVTRFTLMSQYLWAVWSVIRAPQKCTFNEFDLAFAQMRGTRSSESSGVSWKHSKRQGQEAALSQKTHAPH